MAATSWNGTASLIWDPIYKRCAWRFLEAFAARYDANPNTLFLDVTPDAETNPYRFGTIARTDPGFKDRYAETKARFGSRALAQQRR